MKNDSQEKYEEFNASDFLMMSCPFKSRALRFLWRMYKVALWPFYSIWVRQRLHKVSGLHEELAKSKRIDISPVNSGGRGFIITIDRKSALYFYQEGDHFVYDGCEMGEYEKGDVTIFDKK